jgi:hypothetical protein
MTGAFLGAAYHLVPERREGLLTELDLKVLLLGGRPGVDESSNRAAERITNVRIVSPISRTTAD